MKLGSCLVVCASWIEFAITCLANPIPTIAPTPEQIAEAMNLPGSSIKLAPANIDPVLSRDKGVRWRHYYRLSTKPGYTLKIAVLSPKYVPKPDEALGEPDKANPPERKSVAPNGDVIHVFASPIPGNRVEHVARLERHQGDWDLLVTIFPDTEAPPTNPSMLEDKAMKSLVEKTAEILSKPPSPPAQSKTTGEKTKSKQP